jgi:hypothetical protein
MRLVGRSGHCLELTLLGYQFPAIEDDEFELALA